jgi:hypothetical protein
MILWDILNNNPEVDEEAKRKIKICESCEFLGKNSNCTISECGCFVTSMVLEKKECPVHKW